eukprot:gene4045-5165_t
MYDDNDGGGMFGTSGLINGDMTRRPAADYFFQVNKVFGDYSYKETTYQDPILDRYERSASNARIAATDSVAILASLITTLPADENALTLHESVQ